MSKELKLELDQSVDEVIDEVPGSSFIALRKLRWSENSPFKLDIRKWYTNSNGEEVAGKGISYGDDKYSIDTNGEYGMYLAVSIIVPKVYNYQGCNRHVLHTTRLDFWTPEFDNLGTQAISSATPSTAFSKSLPTRKSALL